MKVVDAVKFISEKHLGQTRKVTGVPYISHPFIVMCLVGKYKSQSKHFEELQCAALLHDTIEDTECSYFEIEENFGSLVASLVLELTSNQNLIAKQGKNEYLKNKMSTMSSYALFLKLVDRLSNITDMPTKKYVNNTLELMTHIQNARQDLSVTHINVINDIIKECNAFNLIN